jgi:hypothetical protein
MAFFGWVFLHEHTAYINELYGLSLVCPADVLDVSGERKGVESLFYDDWDSHWWFTVEVGWQVGRLKTQQICRTDLPSPSTRKYAIMPMLAA